MYSFNSKDNFLSMDDVKFQTIFNCCKTSFITVVRFNFNAYNFFILECFLSVSNDEKETGGEEINKKLVYNNEGTMLAG